MDLVDLDLTRCVVIMCKDQSHTLIGVAVGALVVNSEPMMHLVALAVEEARRNEKIGTHLTEMMRCWGKVHVECHEHLCAFYDSCGFVPDEDPVYHFETSDVSVPLRVMVAERNDSKEDNEHLVIARRAFDNATIKKHMYVPFLTNPLKDECANWALSSAREQEKSDSIDLLCDALFANPQKAMTILGKRIPFEAKIEKFRKLV